jgi:hypothetical protein
MTNWYASNPESPKKIVQNFRPSNVEEHILLVHLYVIGMIISVVSADGATSVLLALLTTVPPCKSTKISTLDLAYLLQIRIGLASFKDITQIRKYGKSGTTCATAATTTLDINAWTCCLIVLQRTQGEDCSRTDDSSNCVNRCVI